MKSKKSITKFIKQDEGFHVKGGKRGSGGGERGKGWKGWGEMGRWVGGVTE